MRFYCIQVGEEGRDTIRFYSIRNALCTAYSAARFDDEPVTVLQADGEDDALVYSPLAVISALPIVSTVPS